MQFPRATWNGCGRPLSRQAELLIVMLENRSTVKQTYQSGSQLHPSQLIVVSVTSISLIHDVPRYLSSHHPSILVSVDAFVTQMFANLVI